MRMRCKHERTISKAEAVVELLSYGSFLECDTCGSFIPLSSLQPSTDQKLVNMVNALSEDEEEP